MGCAKSKTKPSHNAVSEYQLAALEDWKDLKKTPVPVNLDKLLSDGSVCLRQFHNLLYDGFYAPYIRNPNYMLIVDTRDEEAFLQKHVVTAKYHNGIGPKDINDDCQKYSLIVLYDDDGSGIEKSDSKINALFQSFKDHKMDPVCIDGGYKALETDYVHLLSTKQITVNERVSMITWYPSIIKEKSLYLGRSDQATNPEVVFSLGLTHIVSLTRTSPTLVMPNVKYLVVPINPEVTSGGGGTGSQGTKEGDLLSNLPHIIKFLQEAATSNGRALVHGDEGVNRSAVVVTAYLMKSEDYTLEDAYLLVKTLRPAVQASEALLQELLQFEIEIFGKRLSSLESIWF